EPTSHDFTPSTSPRAQSSPTAPWKSKPLWPAQVMAVPADSSPSALFGKISDPPWLSTMGTFTSASQHMETSIIGMDGCSHTMPAHSHKRQFCVSALTDSAREHGLRAQACP